MASNVIASNNNINKIAKAMGDGTKNGVSKDLSTVASAVNIFVDQLIEFGKKDLKSLKGSSQQFINTFKLYVDVVDAITSVDTSVFKKASNINSINKFTENFGALIVQLGTAFDSMAQLGKEDDAYTNLRKVLTGKKITKDKSDVNDNGVGMTTNTTEESGSLMDCVNMILEVYKSLSTLETHGPLKGWWKKNVTNKLILATFKNDILGLFENIWKETVRVFSPFSGKTVKKTYTAIQSLQKVTLTLPSLIEELSMPFIYIGKEKRTKKLQSGFEMVVGTGDVVAETKDSKAHKTYLIGVVMDTLESFALINRTYGNELNAISPMLTTFGDALKNIVKTLVFVSINALGIWVGSWVLLGSKKKKGRGGLIGTILMAMTRIQQKNKDITLATKSLVDISKALLLLSSAAMLIVMTGILIIQARWFVLAGLGFVALLVGIVSVLASKLFQKNIKEGSKSILLLSSAIALISLTAVLIAYTGQFILTSWDSVLQVGLLVVVLGIVMWGLSHMKDTVLESTKTILLLSLAIGLISLIAVGLVWVSQYIKGDWESIGMFILIMGVIALAVWGLSKIGEKVQKNIEGVLAISISVILISASVLIFAQSAKIIAQSGGHTAFLLAVAAGAGMFWIFGKMMKKLGKFSPAILIGIAAALAIAAVIHTIGELILKIATSIKLITDTAKLIKDEDWGTNDEGNSKSMLSYLLLPIGAFTGLMTYVLSMSPLILTSRASILGLSDIATSVGKMASVLQDIAHLRMPIDFDKKGNPTGFREMTSEDFVYAGQNAAAVADVLINMFSEDGADKQVTIAGKTITLATINLGDIPKLKDKHAERMNRLALITDSVGKMATVVRDIAMMTIPKIDENTGKQIGVTKMTPEDFTKASNNVKTITETILGVFKDDDLIDAIEDLDEDNAKVITAVMDSVGNLTSIMDVLVMIHNNQIPNVSYQDGKLVKGSNTISIDDITKNRLSITQRISSLLRMPLDAILTIDEDLIEDAEDVAEDLNEVVKCAVDSTKYVVEWYNTTLKSINVDELNTKYEGTNKTLSSLVALFTGKKFTSSSASSFDKQTKSLVSVLKQVNETDFDKLKYTYSLVSKLAEFAKSIRGDFDKLAECINEDLIEAIEKLNETLNGTSKDINVTTTTTAQMLPNNSGTDKQPTTANTNETNALKAQIAELQRQLAELKNAQKPQRLRLDSTGAVMVKIAN